jgi:hypothetical protein
MIFGYEGRRLGLNSGGPTWLRGKKGLIVQVRGPAHLSEQCGELLLWSLSNDLRSCLAEHLL